MQRPAGDPVKTDAKDALHLARLLRLDEVSSVRVPTVAEEAARDVVPAREDVRSELMRARHRVEAALRQGIVWSGGNAWTQVHHGWLGRQSFDQRGVQVAFDTAYEAVLFAQSRRDRLDKTIAEMAADPAWAPIVSRLQSANGGTGESLAKAGGRRLSF